MQRFGDHFAGGSEALAKAYFEILKKDFQVTVLSTNAIATNSWAPEKKLKSIEGVFRFPVDKGRSDFWHQLDRMWNEFKDLLPVKKLKLENLWIEHQGPTSTELIRFLIENSFDRVLFFTYLYSPTIEGLLVTEPKKAILVPTLHTEKASSFRAIQNRLQNVPIMLYNTDAERDLIIKTCNQPVRLEPAGYPVQVPEYENSESTILSDEKPYFLYCGRINPLKGVNTIISYLKEYRQLSDEDFELILTGNLDMKLPSFSWIRYIGFVSEKEKFELMRNARAFLTFSENESLSIVVLESISLGTPVITSDRATAIKEHVEKTGSGKVCRNLFEFILAADAALKFKLHDRNQSTRAKAYIADRYGYDSIKKTLSKSITSQL